MKTLTLILLLTATSFNSIAQYKPYNAKKQRDIGMVLTGDGIIFTSIGVLVLGKWVSNIIQEDATGHVDVMNQKEFFIGAGMTLVGITFEIIGVPMWIQGRTQLRISGNQVGISINLNKKRS
jgi:hypothetical protein